MSRESKEGFKRIQTLLKDHQIDTATAVLSSVVQEQSKTEQTDDDGIASPASPPLVQKMVEISEREMKQFPTTKKKREIDFQNTNMSLD